jgi:hypothetical protein
MYLRWFNSNPCRAQANESLLLAIERPDLGILATKAERVVRSQCDRFCD